VKKTHFVGIVLAAALLAAPWLVGSTSSAGVYDPWCDLDDDGDIDIFDIVRAAGAYGTSGEPYSAKAALAYDSGWLDISDKAGQYFNITHNLHSTALVIDVAGKIVPNGDPHQKHYGGPGDAEPVGWIQRYGGPQGEEGYAVVHTSDGGYALAGVTFSFGAGSGDFWLVKTDTEGTMEWNRTYGGAGLERAHALVQTSDGGYALAGYTDSFGAGNQDVWVVKTDSNGNMEWNRTYGGAGRDSAESIVQTSDAGYAVAGETCSFGEPNGDFWLVKTDGSGNAVWNCTYGALEPNLHSPIGDFAYSLIQTADGGYAMAGATHVWSGMGDLFYTSWWLVKTDPAGAMQWNQTFAYEYWSAIATCVIQTHDGGYAVAGPSGLTENTARALLVKTNASGGREWAVYHSGPDEAIEAWSMVLTEDEGYALAGSWLADEGRRFCLVKANATGQMQWTRIYEVAGYGPFAQSVVRTTDGGYVLAGYSSHLTDGDFVMVKTDAFGLIADCELGLSLSEYTADTLTLYRGAIDPYWNYVRICVWAIREP
jgi:hypothetical protein